MKVYVNGKFIVEFAGTLPVEKIREILSQYNVPVEGAKATVDGDNVYFTKKADTLG